jgi:hypothetical protein
MVKKKDKIYAIIVNPQQYAEYQKAAQDRLFTLMDEVHARNADISEAEVLQDVTEAVEAVRHPYANGT